MPSRQRRFTGNLGFDAEIISNLGILFSATCVKDCQRGLRNATPWSYTILHVIHFELQGSSENGIPRIIQNSVSSFSLLKCHFRSMPYSTKPYETHLGINRNHVPNSWCFHLEFGISYSVLMINKLNLCMNSKQFFELSQYIFKKNKTLCINDICQYMFVGASQLVCQIWMSLISALKVFHGISIKYMSFILI